MRQDLSTDVRGRDVLIVEDIVDSGVTLSWLVNELKRRGAASVEIFALLEKPARHAFSQAMSIPLEMDFMSLSSSGSGPSTSGTVTGRQDLSTDVRGREVLSVEAIDASAVPLSGHVNEMKRRGAASVEIFARLETPARHQVQLDVKYKGFVIPDEFVVGFGLDFDEEYRNLESIAVLKPEVYEGELA